MPWPRAAWPCDALHTCGPRIAIQSDGHATRRIYGLFEADEIDQVRKVLGYQMRAFVYQKLLPTLHEKIHRIPGIEILINNAVVRKHILEGREGELREYLQSVEARQTGMIDFNDCLVQLVEKEYIHVRVAMEASPNVDELNMKLKKLG